MLPSLSNMPQETHQVLAKAAKQTKVRRTRQPRNPQLSVARRNERERNRVKMVNNGFALLREHLPVEDLQAFEQSGSDTPTPDGGSVTGGKSGKAKKFSKVETLRAAIQRIKMLEELIRSTEPGFESMNISGSATAHLADMYDEEEPLSVCESSNSTTTMSQPITAMSQSSNIQQQSQYQQEHFIKLEPQFGSHIHQAAPTHNLPSPHNSHSSQASSSSSSAGLNTNQYNNTPSATQVHLNYNNNHHHHHHQQQSHSQPQQQMPSGQSHHLVPHSPINSQQQEQPSLHTHLWIQQHQSSFMEQQQLQHQYDQQQQQQLMDTSNNWYAQQQFEAKQNDWFMQQQHHQSAESPEQLSGHQQQHSEHHQQATQGSQQHPNQVESPVWQYASISPSTVQTQMPFGQHHQISLYSQ